MEIIALLVMLGGLVGACVGYFLSIYVVIVLTVFVVWLVYSETKPVEERRGSGHFGAMILCVPPLVSFVLFMWITWFFTTDLKFVIQPVLDFVRRYILK